MSAGTEQVTDMSVFEAGLDRPTIHDFPAELPFNRSGAECPQPGDVARCGHVKVRSHRPEYADMAVTCEGCRTLRGLL